MAILCPMLTLLCFGFFVGIAAPAEAKSSAVHTAKVCVTLPTDWSLQRTTPDRLNIGLRYSVDV